MGAEHLNDLLDPLTDILAATVRAGASVHFIDPFDRDDAHRYWQTKMYPDIRSGDRLLFVARETAPPHRPMGTVQLVVSLPPNQAHRCEVSKLLVHPEFRRRGVARALMTALEDEARRLGKALITLDTREGDSADRLYRDMGYVCLGAIPDFARHPQEDRLEGATLFYKSLTN